MARLSITIQREAQPTYVGEDVLIACEKAGLNRSKLDLFDDKETTEGFVVDYYAQSIIDDFTVGAIAGYLGQMGGLVEVEQMAGWPMRGWAYAAMPVEY